MAKIPQWLESDGKGLDLEIIDGWLHLKTDEGHLEKLPEEIYDLKGIGKIRIKGSITKWLRNKLKEEG